MQQITREQAVEIFDSKRWEKWTDDEIVRFQLFQERLAMPFDRFHQAVEAVLKRPVWTHEFAFVDGLRAEYRKERPAPTFDDIVGLLPADKTIVVAMSHDVAEE